MQMGCCSFLGAGAVAGGRVGSSVLLAQSQVR